MDPFFAAPRLTDLARPEQDWFRPSVDVKEREADFLVHAELPGVKKEDIKLDVNAAEGFLELSGRKESRSEEKALNRFSARTSSYPPRMARRSCARSVASVSSVVAFRSLRASRATRSAPSSRTACSR